MDETLTWLHISDIHFYYKTEWRNSASRRELLNLLEKRFSENDELWPDVIFCTGDIAFGESRLSPLGSQYEAAKSFFEDLLLVCGRDALPLPKDRLFVIPGNHDVNRNSINTDAQDMLTTWAATPDKHVDTINQRLNDRSKEFVDTIKRLSEYDQFISDYLPHQFDDDGRVFYARVCEIKGMKVGIAGFNSAWTCSGPEDDRNIWMGAHWQFNKASEILKQSDIRIGLIHHPVDWVNLADRKIAQHRIASDFHFWLHGHSHNAWVTPGQSYIEIAAGAIGAKESDEFGINITKINIRTRSGITYLYSKKAGANGWTITPVEHHAENGQWKYELPRNLLGSRTSESPRANDGANGKDSVRKSLVDKLLSMKFEEAMKAYPSQPLVWVNPEIRTHSEVSQDAKSSEKMEVGELIKNPRSTIIKAPPQYGLTCLALYMVREAWRNGAQAFWLYLDVQVLKPHSASINENVSKTLASLEQAESEIKCVVLDSWSQSDKDATKLFKKVCERFPNLPIICMQAADTATFMEGSYQDVGRQFDVFYLWALSRGGIRKIVEGYNEHKFVGDEDAVTTRITSDLDTLNLHRTPLNCLILLKVSEIDFDESPINRSEVIKRVLFLLFNTDFIPTYKSRPDLKDCEYVIGYFCEQLIREGARSFTRERFLNEINKCCQDSLIDLETHVVFDVLYSNNILVKRGSFYHFKFSYWIFYFTAQRMHHDAEFAKYVFDQRRYAQYPEIVEFYTGIDRQKDDALEILIRDIRDCREHVRVKCGLPENWNPFQMATWNPSPDMQNQMQKILDEGVRESNFPAVIKDQYADQTYDPSKPYDQQIPLFLAESSFDALTQIIVSGSRALRNSDYVSTAIKQQLLEEILKGWEQITKILLVILPVLARDGQAQYDGAGFVVVGKLDDDPQKRFIQILCGIPNNIVGWYQDDLYSRKMGPLLMKQLEVGGTGEIAKHELILFLISKKPRDWHKQVQNYIGSVNKNSYYLYDTFNHLRSDYSYCFASTHTLKDMEYLIKLAAAKHATGSKLPNSKTIEKISKANDHLIPPREV